MRKYSQKLVNKFKAAYNEKSGKTISDSEANQKLGTLADLVRTIAPNSNSNLLEGNDTTVGGASCQS